jgi:choline kinase
MKAIILSAGRGSRLGADDVPKPLWEIGPRSADDATPETLLERQIRCLRRAGVEQIGVVVGWRREAVAERLRPLRVTLIDNTHPDISASGTTHSIQFAACSSFDPFDGQTPVLIMDGDIVYEQRLLDTVIRAGGRTAIFVVPAVQDDAEEVRVYSDRTGPRLVGKGLSARLTDDLELIGEATGIWRVAPEDHALFKALLTWLVGRPDGSAPYGFAGIASEHEELAQYMITLGRLEAQRLNPDLLFMEVDFRDELERVRNQVYPKILKKDAG